MASPPSPNDLTRQQLDELDSLLQRMLSLPLTSPAAPNAAITPPPMPESISTVAATGWRTDPVAPARMPHFTGDAAMVPLTPALSAIARTHVIPPPTWGPDPLVRHAPPTTGTLRGVDAPALPPGYRTPEPMPILPEPVAVVEPPSAPVVETPGIPLPLWPLFGINWVLELLLGLLGPVGTVVKHPAMKHFLGVAGVLLVLAAGVWSAKGQGWISLPWPR